MQRQPALDGIRGLAIAAVFIHHHGRLNSGWVGVDLFFVLSGYLITGILRRTRDDVFYWKRFWVKRATRILPPLILLCFALVFLYRLPIRWTAGLLLTLGDYLAYKRPFLEASGVLWSLAVEEHFYSIWPFAVRYLVRRKLLALTLFIIFAEPLVRGIAQLKFHPAWYLTYYLSPFRLDGLALGCLLALLLEAEDTSAIVRKLSGWAGGLALAVYCGLRFYIGFGFTRDGNGVTYNALAYSLIGVAAFGLIGHVLTHPKSILARVLGAWPLASLGIVSYGLYLYHTVVRDALMYILHKPERMVMTAGACLSIVVALLSYRLVELPIMKWGNRRLPAYTNETKDRTSLATNTAVSS